MLCFQKIILQTKCKSVIGIFDASPRWRPGRSPKSTYPHVGSTSPFGIMSLIFTCQSIYNRVGKVLNEIIVLSKIIFSIKIVFYQNNAKSLKNTTIIYLFFGQYTPCSKPES